MSSGQAKQSGQKEANEAGKKHERCGGYHHRDAPGGDCRWQTTGWRQQVAPWRAWARLLSGPCDVLKRFGSATHLATSFRPPTGLKGSC